MRKLDTFFLLALLCLVPHAIRGEEAKKSNKKRSSKSSATTYSPFFIKGGQYFRYSHGQDKVAEGSPKNLKQITGLWAQVDAALMWGVKSAFLSQGKGVHANKYQDEQSWRRISQAHRRQLAGPLA
ncbi:MAG: hypothetical protein QGG53_21420 [Planctomycetota bacterium]|jgi:hypothetical protein|nr:hypothetical protein [Planctomycetota bacterium]|tara:strand:- start:36 stop:413 length:378 start_codon:yes stop_codon:yes gene_type:complete